MAEESIVFKLNNLHKHSVNMSKKGIKVIDRKLYKLINKELLLLAYDNLKSKPGNLTPAMNPETLDGIDEIYIDNLVQSIKDESFQFRASRQILIPKPSGGLRPLRMAPPRDKLVQECIRLILNAIYEPRFLPCSHGFRPYKSCHTALKDIRMT